MVSMHAQLKQLWMHVEALANRHGYQKEWAWSRDLSNNNTWLNKLPVTDFLRDLGPGMRLGEMLSRDTYVYTQSQEELLGYLVADIRVA